MFGRNPVKKPSKSIHGKTLQVVQGSPFSTIQGEGPFAGTPATFVRLHGCNLRCWFCDTDFSNPNDPKVDIEDLFVDIVARGNKLVVLTGGEPLLQNIVPFVKLLQTNGYTVQIETAGTIYRNVFDDALVVVSPKTRRLSPDVYKRAHIYKYVVSAEMDFNDNGIPLAATQPGSRMVALAAPESSYAEIYYSPMDEYDPAKNKANMALAAELAMAYGRKLTLQMHKIVNLP